MCPSDPTTSICLSHQRLSPGPMRRHSALDCSVGMGVSSRHTTMMPRSTFFISSALCASASKTLWAAAHLSRSSLVRMGMLLVAAGADRHFASITAAMHSASSTSPVGVTTSTEKRLPLARTMILVESGYCTSVSMPLWGHLALAKIGLNAELHILPLPSASSLPSRSFRVHLVKECTNWAARIVCVPGRSCRPKNGLTFTGAVHRSPLYILSQVSWM
mmetsp:Transcript_18974/g.31891  ORF Transcript_18974/g.31891 Transcript_18974/m.31891 type:complete len:218 (-) Transcript_18974:490-1143(-)